MKITWCVSHLFKLIILIKVYNLHKKKSNSIKIKKLMWNVRNIVINNIISNDKYNDDK